MTNSALRTEEGGLAFLMRPSFSSLLKIGSRVWLVTMLGLLTLGTSVVVAAEDAAQRQLREDRERFQREVQRQTNDAKAADAASRAAVSQVRTVEELERLRVQQSAQQTQIRKLDQRYDERSVQTILPRSGTEVFSPVEQPASIALDFAITLLADGNCVVHRKGHLPEVKTPEEAAGILKTLLSERTPAPAPAGSVKP